MAVLKVTAKSVLHPFRHGKRKEVARWPPSVDVLVRSGLTARLEMRIPIKGVVITQHVVGIGGEFRTGKRTSGAVEGAPPPPIHERDRNKTQGHARRGPSRSTTPACGDATRPADLVFVPTSAC